MVQTHSAGGISIRPISCANRIDEQLHRLHEQLKGDIARERES